MPVVKDIPIDQQMRILDRLTMLVRVFRMLGKYAGNDAALSGTQICADLLEQEIESLHGEAPRDQI